MGKRKKDEKTASGTEATSSPPAASSRKTGQTRGGTQFSVTPTTSAAITKPPAADLAERRRLPRGQENTLRGARNASPRSLRVGPGRGQDRRDVNGPGYRRRVTPDQRGPLPGDDSHQRPHRQRAASGPESGLESV